MSRTIRGLGITLMILISAGLFALGVLVNTGHLGLQPVLSGSMRPAFQPGDLVADWQVPVSSLRTGDVIAFVPPGKTARTEHRIVKLDRMGATTKVVTRGDANHGNNDPWGPVTLRGNSAYKLEAVIPKLGFVTNIRRLVPALLVLAGLIFLLSEGTRLLKSSRRSEIGPTTATQ